MSLEEHLEKKVLNKARVRRQRKPLTKNTGGLSRSVAKFSQHASRAKVTVRIKLGK